MYNTPMSITNDIHKRSVKTPEIDWATVPQVLSLGLIGRTTLYRLMQQGEVKSRLVKTSKYAVSGRRLIHVPSFLEFIERSEEGISENNKTNKPSTQHEE